MNEQKADQLLAAVTTLRDMMKDPEVRRALPNLPFDVQEILTPTLCDEDDDEHGGEVEAAMAGRPAAANPKVSQQPPKPEKPKEVDPDIKTNDGTEPPSDMVNSFVYAPA